MYISKRFKHGLLMSAILVLVLYGWYFQTIKNHMDYNLLREKGRSVDSLVSYACNAIDHIATLRGDWDEFKYRDTLIYITEDVDKTKDVYAELFDSNMTGLSKRYTHTEHLEFDMKLYPDLIERMQHEQQGKTVVIDYNRGLLPSHEVLISWRWIPTGDYDKKLLLVIGVTKYSISIRPDDWVLGVVTLLFTTAIFIINGIIVVNLERRKQPRKCSKTCQGEIDGIAKRVRR